MVELGSTFEAPRQRRSRFRAGRRQVLRRCIHRGQKIVAPAGRSMSLTLGQICTASVACHTVRRCAKRLAAQNGHLCSMGQGWGRTLNIQGPSKPAKPGASAASPFLEMQCTHIESAAVRWRGRVRASRPSLCNQNAGMARVDEEAGWRLSRGGGGRWDRAASAAHTPSARSGMGSSLALFRYLIASIRGPSSAALCDVRCEMSMHCDARGAESIVHARQGQG